MLGLTISGIADRAQINPLHTHLAQGISGFAQVIAVARHPVKSFHLAQQPFRVALDLDVDL
jgi:hypothetical protein